MDDNQLQTPFSSSEPTRPSKLTKKKLSLWISLTILALVIIGGVVFYLFFQPKPTPAPVAQNHTPSNATTQPEETPVNRANGIVQKSKGFVEAKLAAKYPQTTATLKKSTSAPYKPSGYDFFVTIAKAPAISATTDPQADKNGATSTETIAKPAADAFRQYLKSENIPKIYSAPWGGSEEYQTNEVLCELSTSLTNATLSCANLGDYPAIAQKVAPLEAALAAKYQTDPNAILQEPIITNSTVQNYKRASINIWNRQSPVGGYAGLFYKTPTSGWQYFTGVQNGLQCSNFNTNDLKNAFAGEPCYTNDTLTTVTPAN